MKTKVVILVMIAMLAAFGVAVVQVQASCWGQATAVFAQMGEMGEHASQQPTPRLGLRNLARALYEAGVIPDDSMQALGAFVADELGLSIDACMDTNGAARAFRAVHLGGRNEVPPVESDAVGTAVFRLSDDGYELIYKVIVANIENVVQGHIHLAPDGANGPVVAFLYGPATPSGTTNGVLAEGTVTEADLLGPLAGAELGDLIAAMEAGHTYVNVHTLANPGGEIRGQIR